VTTETMGFPFSTNIASATYDSEAQTLEVEFHSGHSYTGTNVPQSVWESLRHAPSPGGFFHRMLKGRFGFPP